MQRPLAVVVHYGRLQPTLESVASLRRAAPGTAAWVVDNQGLGEDERPARAESGIDRWLSFGENVGYGRAINLAAAEALAAGEHDLLLALNNDVELEEGALRQLAAALAADARIGAATPRILRRQPEPVIWYDGGGIDWWRGTAVVPRVGAPVAEVAVGEPRDVDFVSGCVLLLRLEALQRVGGFDPRYFLYEEDVELSLRLRAAGWRLRHVPAATAYHLGQASQRSDEEPFLPIHHPRHPRLARLVELRVGNRLLTARRHARGGDRLRFVLGFPAYWLGKCLQAALAGRPGIALAAGRGLARYRRLRRLPSAEEALTAHHRSGV